MNGDNEESSENLIDLHRRHFLRGLAASPFAGAALSAEAGATSSREITVRQGGTEVATVVPYSHGMNVDRFYSYNGEYRGSQNSSANTPSDVDLEQGSVSQLFFHEHDGTLSLVMIHDEPGANSGSHRVEFEELPDGGSWTVKDDPTHAPDEYPADGSFAEWGWGSCCTDGGAYSWSDEGAVEFTVTPAAHSSRANAPFEGIHTWKLRSGDGTSATLDKSQPVTVTVRESVPGDELGTLVDEKLALADSITKISPSIDERARVEDPLAALEDAVEAGNLSEATASEAVERMIAGEQCTDALLTGISPDAEGGYDTAGRIVDFCVDAFIELLLTAVAFGRAGKWVGFGRLGKAMGKARSTLSRGVSKIADTLTSGLSKVSNRVRNKSEIVSEFLENLIKEEGIKEGTTLATKAAAEVSGWRDDVANEFVGLVERNALFTDVNDKISDLNEAVDPADGGPDLSGTFEGAKEASGDSISDIDDTLQESEDRLDTLKLALTIVGFLDVVAVALVATFWGSLASAVWAMISLILRVGLALAGAADGAEFMGRALSKHNEGIDGVIAGQPGG